MLDTGSARSTAVLQVGTARQAIELSRPEGEVGWVCGFQRGQQVYRREGGIVPLPVGGDEADAGDERIGIFSVARRSGPKCGTGKPDARRGRAAKTGKDRGGVQPRRSNLFERRLAPPTDRQIGPLENAETRVMVQTFEGA